MKISELTINNWRSIHNETINFIDLMIFIGQNNHGKSNILSSLLFFFGEIGLDALDFHNESTELFIEIEFSELDQNDLVTFKKYLSSNNTIRVRKSATKCAQSTYNGYIELPNEPWLKEENISQFTKREIAEGLPLYSLLPETGRITKDIFQSAQQEYLSQNQESIELNYSLESSPFLGAKNVAKGIFGDIFYIPSVKKASEDLATKGKSVFSELYARVIRKMSETNSEFKDAKQKIHTLIQILNKHKPDGTENTSRPPELTYFEDSIQTELDTWNTSIDVEITPPDLDDIFKVSANVWIDDGIRTDVNRKGQGLQRALVFALVKSLAKLTKQERESQQEGASTRSSSKSTYFIIEEPELFLHPQAQRELFSSLRELTKTESQVILCTHSSAFLSLDHYKSIGIVRKRSNAVGTTIFQYTEELFPDENQKKSFNMTYWVNPDRGELFFAKKIILVEGATDKTILPLLAHKIGVFRYDFTVIDCGSKDNIPYYIHVLNKFQLPYVAVYDIDHQEGKSQDAIASADKSSAKITTIVDSSLGVCIELVNDIEEEIGVEATVIKNKPFIAIEHIKDDNFEISSSLQEKIEQIFQ